MPLTPTILQSGIVAAFQGGGPPAQVASRLSRAYVDYARLGTAGGASPIFTGIERPRLEASLRAALQVPNAPGPLPFAGAWAIGLTAFWAGVLFPGGSATGMPGVAALPPPVVAALVNQFNTVPLAARLLATAIDICTRTLIVVIAGVPVPFV